MRIAPLVAMILALSAGAPWVSAHEPHVCPGWLPETPNYSGHIEQVDIVSGYYDFKFIFEKGRELFKANFNRCDGQGRPGATGTGASRTLDQPSFIRTSAPDSSSCAGCHTSPRAGGSGDFVVNVFVLAQARDPVTDSVSADFSNERNTLGMFGSGAIEMLAREMSDDLLAQLHDLPDGRHVLTTKGVDFEVTTAGGKVVSSKGVDTDLIIKPFHQSGVVRSLREFTVNAFNHHHGMQAEERFDLIPDNYRMSSPDQDGVARELTVGDITAATIFQVGLAIPGRVMPDDPTGRLRVRQGEALFGKIGCASCHVPEMKLNSRYFVEPNPRNLKGTFNDRDQSVRFDLSKDGEQPRLERTSDGGAVVRAYTDLKRHNLCDASGKQGAIRHFCNERLAQGRPEQDGQSGADFFLTRKLWDVGNSPPYGHRGDLTTITEAILAHGGEGRASRDKFVALSRPAQSSIVTFLKTLQVLPLSDVP